MDSDAISACRAQVLRSGTMQPLGWGTVISRHEFLTCTHVVHDALGDLSRTEAITVKFVDLQGAPACELRIGPICYPPTSGPEPLRDICVLEPIGGSFPDGVRPALFHCDELPVGTEVMGRGLSELHPKGHGIGGKVHTGGSQSRVEFNAYLVDLVPDQGSSGTPLFIHHHGRYLMAGMVAEVQGQQTGVFIPCRHLQKHISSMQENSGRRGIAVAGQAFPNPLADLLDHLKDNVHRINRDEQVTDFHMRVEAGGNSRESFVCLVAGTSSDMPKKLRKRIEYELGNSAARTKSYFKAVKSVAELTATEIHWPTTKEFVLEDRFNSMIKRLGNGLSHLKDFSDYKAICEILNSDYTPRIFFSDVPTAKFGRLHLQLLQRWLDFLRELNCAGLEKPFPHILFFEFEEDRDPEQVKAEVAKLLSVNNNPFFRLLKGAGWSLAREHGPLKHEVLLQLAPLEMIEEDEVEDWLKAIVEELSLDKPEKARTIRNLFVEKFTDQKKVRLLDIRRELLAAEKKGIV